MQTHGSCRISYFPNIDYSMYKRSRAYSRKVGVIMKSDWEELVEECYKIAQKRGLTREDSDRIIKDVRSGNISEEFQELLRISFDESLSKFEREMQMKRWFEEHNSKI